MHHPRANYFDPPPLQGFVCSGGFHNLNFLDFLTPFDRRMNISALLKTSAFLLFAGCLCMPLTGCGSTATNPGVDDGGLEEDAAFKETEEYVQGEGGI